MRKLTDDEKIEKHRMIVRRSYYQKKVRFCLHCVVRLWMRTPTDSFSSFLYVLCRNSKRSYDAISSSSRSSIAQSCS